MGRSHDESLVDDGAAAVDEVGAILPDEGNLSRVERYRVEQRYCHEESKTVPATGTRSCRLPPRQQCAGGCDWQGPEAHTRNL